MNVELAAQLLSESIATSLEFCLEEKIHGFERCEATINFIRIFSTLFDILNSRNLNAKGCKCPIQDKNNNIIQDFLVKAEVYVRSLKLEGRDILKSNRRTGFIGFLYCIRSIQILYGNFVSSVGRPLKFLMTYKFSQDHIENFFGQIRSMAGHNDNPSARHFSAAYKRILIHNEIMDTLRGNCLSLESVSILTASSLNGNSTALQNINDSVPKQRLLDYIYESNSDEKDDEYIYIPSKNHLSKCSGKIVAYIAGFVVFKLKRSFTVRSVYYYYYH